MAQLLQRDVRRFQGTTAPKEPKKKYKPEFVLLAFSEWLTGEVDSSGNYRAFCPLCEDPETSNSPSGAFQIEKGVFNCFKSEHHYSIYELAREMKRTTGWDPRRAAMSARNKDPKFRQKVENGLAQAGKRSAPLPSAEEVSAWTKRLLSSDKVLNEFQTRRGIDRQSIQDLKIGWDGYRYTIPIYDDGGVLVNVRRYKLNSASASDKIINIAGHGQAAIYGYDDLRDYDRIILTEGETDRIRLRQEMRKDPDNEFGVVTHTAGARTFRTEWGGLFRDKTVYIGYDNDDTGKQGANKAARIVAPFAKAVFKVTVPVDKKGGDWTDWIQEEGATRRDILDLLGSVQPSAGKKNLEGPVEESGLPVTIADSTAEKYQGQVLEFIGSIVGRLVEPYSIPRKVLLTCSMDKGPSCQVCPLLVEQGEMVLDIQKNDPDLFRFIDATEDRRNRVLKDVSGVRCMDRVAFDVDETYYIEEIVVQPSVDERIDSESQRPVTRTVFSVGTHNSLVNDKVRIVGRNVVDSKTSKVRFMAWVNEKMDLDIDNFSLQPDEIEQLKVFQPGEGESPLDKCMDIAADMADNVTHIRGRDLLHVAYDLVFHSVLTMSVYDVVVSKGWLEMMIVGDTRTGKSEIANRLIHHYRAGVLTSLEGASFAGIVGGAQQVDNRWHLTWGLVPMNDRRLVVLDEASGMKDKNLIEQMSSVRSSGVAQINKIAGESTSARTRLVWITNPADGSMLSDHPDVGMAALRSVVPNNEDIARFDFVTSAAKDEVPDKMINKTFRESKSPEYASELCEILVKWAWSLSRADIRISKEAANRAIRKASEMGRKYIPDPPLIQSENVRFKILRIACALAARTFSYSDGKLQVGVEHVDDAVRFLDEIYSVESMGYARVSRRILKARVEAESNRAEVKEWMKDPDGPLRGTLRMAGGSRFRTRDFQDFGGMDVDAARATVNRLVRMRMVRRLSRGEIAMEPALIQILKEFEDEEE